MTVTVSTSGLEAVPVQFHYDEAGTVTLHALGRRPPLPRACPSRSATARCSRRATNVIVAHGGSATTAQLFPYTTGYTIWYGDCTTQGTVITGAAHRGHHLRLSPQGTATAQITGLDTLTLAVTQTGAGSKAPTATATVADPNAATDGCSTSNGEVYTLTGISGSGTAYTRVDGDPLPDLHRSW